MCSRKIRFWSCGRNTREFTIRRIGDTVNAAKTAAAGDLRVDVNLRIPRDTKTEKKSRRQRSFTFGSILKTEWPAVR